MESERLGLKPMKEGQGVSSHILSIVLLSILQNLLLGKLLTIQLNRLMRYEGKVESPSYSLYIHVLLTPPLIFSLPAICILTTFLVLDRHRSTAKVPYQTDQYASLITGRYPNISTIAQQNYLTIAVWGLNRQP